MKAWRATSATGVFILARTWGLLREAVGILLEGTPASVNLEAVRAAIAATPGVESVHDLHVWTLTTGMNALSAHAVLCSGAGHAVVLDGVRRCVKSRFDIAHVTLQIEDAGCGDSSSHV